jgi:hypothetical protein
LLFSVNVFNVLNGYFVIVFLFKFIIIIIYFYRMMNEMISKMNINEHVYLDHVHHLWDFCLNFQQCVSDQLCLFSFSSGVISIHQMLLDHHHLKVNVFVWRAKILIYEEIYWVWMGLNIIWVKGYLLSCFLLFVWCCYSIYQKKHEILMCSKKNSLFPLTRI